MNIYNGATVNNPGYFDVPICNSLSNTTYRDQAQDVGEYDLNQRLNVTTNDNYGNYVVYQRPTMPSSSLYIESDAPASPYYQQSFTKVPNYPPLLVKKKEMVPYDNGVIESFENASIYDGYNSGSDLGYSSVNNNSLYVPNNIVQRSRYVTHANRDYSQFQQGGQFLNIGSMPNVSSYYINSPNANLMQPQVHAPMPSSVVQMQPVAQQGRPYPQPVIAAEMPKKIVRMSNNDEEVDMSRKRREKRSNKEKSGDGKQNNMLFYITIILLCIIIIMLMMKSIKR